MAFELNCPIPVSRYPVITMAHGSGGKLSQQLVSEMFVPAFDNDLLSRAHDGSVFSVEKGRMALTTDSFVVKPLFFPGGNIGDLAVNGTVNDLACCGAEALYLTAGFILEEGLGMQELWEVVVAMKQAAEKAGVRIVTGDTKVVDRGSGDKIFINTSGTGRVIEDTDIGPANCIPGDAVILTGSIAEHGIAVLSARSGLEFESGITSDTAPLNDLTAKLLREIREVHVLRDPTRGGIASALNEICQSSRTGMLLDEADIPVSEAVKGACEVLGLDPLYIANEGKMLVILPEKLADKALGILRAHPLGRHSALIGRVTVDHPGMLRMKTAIGSTRVVDMIAGEQLPRIC